MGRWQPPIPSGALWSQEVIQSNAGALLAYCYDAVLTDGTFTIQLAEAAGEMNVDYRTLKRWWSALRSGSFFKSVQDKGRKGFLVRMADDWLDWRILKARQVVQAEGPKISLENDSQGIEMPHEESQVVFKGISSTNDGPDLSLETPAYKVLMTSQDHDSSLASDDAATPPEDEGETIVTNTPNRNPRGRKLPPAAPLAIRQVMADMCQIDIDGGTASKGQVIDLNKQAGRAWKAAQAQGKTEAECAEAVRYVAGWIKKTVYPYTNGQPLKPSAILDRWRAAMDARPKPTVYANGAHANGTHPPGDTEQYLTRDQLRALRRGET